MNSWETKSDINVVFFRFFLFHIQPELGRNFTYLLGSNHGSIVQFMSAFIVYCEQTSDQKVWYSSQLVKCYEGWGIQKWFQNKISNFFSCQRFSWGCGYQWVRPTCSRTVGMRKIFSCGKKFVQNQWMRLTI